MNESIWIGGIALMALVVSSILLYPLKIRLPILSCLGLMLFLCLLSAYAWLGNGLRWQTYAAERLKVAQAKALLRQQTPQTVVNLLKQKLAQQPQSAKGWYLLGRIYASQGNWVEARSAFHQAHRLAPDHPYYWVNDLISLCDGVPKNMSKTTRQEFQQLLRIYPNQGDALLFLALDAKNTHHEVEENMYWRRLLKLTPPDSEEAKLIRKMMH